MRSVYSVELQGTVIHIKMASFAQKQLLWQFAALIVTHGLSGSATLPHCRKKRTIFRKRFIEKMWFFYSLHVCPKIFLI
jgi:hypothetical protein